MGAPRDEVEGSFQGRAETQSRGVVLVVRGFPECLEEGGAAQVGHRFREMSVGRLREAAWERWGLAALHADVGGAGAVRLSSSAYVLQPHRPAALRESTRPGGRVRGRAGPAARRGVLDGLIRVFWNVQGPAVGNPLATVV